MKTMKRFLAGMVAVASVMAIAPMSAFADTEIKQDSTNKTGGMVVSYLKSAVSPTFTITIPATANLNAETPTATIKAEDVYLDTTKHKQINVTLDSAQYVNTGDSTFIAKTADGNSQVTYTIGKGEATTGVKVGDTVAEFKADGSVTLNFSAPTGATYAGEHSETLTFGVKLEDANAPKIYNKNSENIADGVVLENVGDTIDTTDTLKGLRFNTSAKMYFKIDGNDETMELNFQPNAQINNVESMYLDDNRDFICVTSTGKGKLIPDEGKQFRVKYNLEDNRWIIDQI